MAARAPACMMAAGRGEWSRLSLSFLIYHSSSSKRTAVLWTRRFSAVLACSTCTHPACCAGEALLRSQRHNGDKASRSPPSVDKCPVMPDLSPGLPLGRCASLLFQELALRNCQLLPGVAARGLSTHSKTILRVLQGVEVA